MPARRARWSLLFGVTLVIAACGGGTTPTTGPGGATANPPGGATAGPVATAGPAATQSGGGPGSGYTGKVCDLLTAGEIEGVMDVTGVTGQETAIISDQGACLYMSGDGKLAVATSFTGGAGAAMVWETWKSQTEAVDVPGTGGEAVFLPSAETTFLLKNGSLIGIQAGPGSAGPDARKAWEAALAKFIAGRL